MACIAKGNVHKKYEFGVPPVVKGPPGEDVGIKRLSFPCATIPLRAWLKILIGYGPLGLAILALFDRRVRNPLGIGRTGSGEEGPFNMVLPESGLGKSLWASGALSFSITASRADSVKGAFLWEGQLQGGYGKAFALRLLDGTLRNWVVSEACEPEGADRGSRNHRGFSIVIWGATFGDDFGNRGGQYNFPTKNDNLDVVIALPERLPRRSRSKDF
ncbi:MAG: hypothetical protein D6694_08295 [Gammaproteobacteria bacterium]|nr:MAG: hypothetical protein D6694_08295 [Gammaproteobacteria bacterium]